MDYDWIKDKIDNKSTVVRLSKYEINLSSYNSFLKEKKCTLLNIFPFDTEHYKQGRINDYLVHQEIDISEIEINKIIDTVILDHIIEFDDRRFSQYITKSYQMLVKNGNFFIIVYLTPKIIKRKYIRTYTQNEIKVYTKRYGFKLKDFMIQEIELNDIKKDIGNVYKGFYHFVKKGE